MDNLISRQAVNDLVDELARSISDERCCISRGRSTATIMQDIVELPPVQLERRWIPVSERLPEDNIKVLVSTETAVGFASHDDIGWYISDGYIDGIIAWMPLPKPYKAESEEA